jgi:Domain of unknown function (DUF4145)
MSEEKYTIAITCKHCVNKAPMLIVAHYSEVTNHEDKKSHDFWDEGPFWEILKCPACENIMLRGGYWHERIHDGTGPDYEILYPNNSKEIIGLPREISESLKAAQRVKTIDSNAFAVLLGRVLDLICIDKEAKGKSLYDRLADIANKNIIPQQLVEMANQLRHLRNIGAHANLGELTPEEIPVLESLINAILEYVYSAPALMKKVQTRIESLKVKKSG